MFYNNEKEFDDFLIKYNITNNHFDLLWKMYINDYASIYRKFEKLKFPGTKRTLYTTTEDMLYLVDRGFLERDVIKVSKYPDPYKLTAKFFDEFTIETGVAFDELYNTYPKIIKVDGKSHSGRNVEYDVAAKSYSKIIGSNINRHNKIIAELKNQIELGMCDSIGMDKWMREQKWRDDTINSNLTKKPLVHGENL